MSIVLGCIADDLTGATDLAMILVHEGMKTVQVVGVPNEGTKIPDADAVVVALKSRTIPAAEAVGMALKACQWLQNAGAKQIFFKYCSTFDSTKDGNIGPVMDALMTKLDCAETIACPSFPENGRTVYRGYLFVNNGLLSESSLRNHPLTPMTDSNLNRILSEQSRSHISNIYFEDVESGSASISEAMAKNRRGSHSIHIVDSITDEHLRSIGHACRGMALVTGGSAVAQGLAANFRSSGQLPKDRETLPFEVPASPGVILAGSCSQATRTQVDFAKQKIPSFRLNALDIIDGKPVVEEALLWAEKEAATDGPIIFYSSADPVTVAQVQQHGGADAGSKIEEVIGEIAQKLFGKGFRRYIVAGGETSGAVIDALGIKSLEIGPQIDPGVPWTKSLEGPEIALALKSGNFGTEDFFLKAFLQLDREIMG